MKKRLLWFTWSVIILVSLYYNTMVAQIANPDIVVRTPSEWEDRGVITGMLHIWRNERTLSCLVYAPGSGVASVPYTVCQ